MSTINVNAGDDAATLKSKVEGAKVGDTVLFSGNAKFNSPGYVQIAKGVKLRCAVEPLYVPWRTVVLDPKLEDTATTETLQRLMCSTTISAPNGQYSFTVADGGELDVEGLTFDGSAIEMKGKSKLTGRKCVVQNFARGPNNGFGSGVGIGHPTAWQAQESVLSEFSWREGNGRAYDLSKGLAYDAPGKEQPKPDGWALGAWRYDGLTVIDSEIVDCANGIKSNNGGATAYRGKFIRVYMSGISRMNDEMQGQVDDFELTDCFVENPVTSVIYDRNADKLEWSEIYHGDKTRNVRARGNTYISRVRSDGTGPRMFRETGNNATCEDNLIIGAGTCFPVFMGDSSGPRSEESIGHTYIRNNCVIDAKNGVGYGYGQYGGNAHFDNNNASVKLTWNHKRGRPGPGRTFKDVPEDPIVPLDPPAGGKGLLGTYFPNIDLSGVPTVTRTDSTIDFDWKEGEPADHLGIDNFSARWAGNVFAPVAGEYTFYTTSDDGVRLWVNGVKLVDNWSEHAPIENSGKITLEAGKTYAVKLEYYEKGHGAQVRLQWSAAGLSKAIVPQTHLFSEAVVPTDPTDPTFPFTRRASVPTKIAIGGQTVNINVLFDVTVNKDKTVQLALVTE